MTTNWDSKFQKQGITFDDVLLIPGKSCVAKRGRFEGPVS